MLPDQPVELRVAKRTSEPYTPSKHSGTAGTFVGAGSRLGAPTPAALERGGSSTVVMPGAFPSGSVGASTSASATAAPDIANINTRFEVDQTLPTTSVQIRFADGTRYDSHALLLLVLTAQSVVFHRRMVCRMNLTHTVMDLRNVINACVVRDSFIH